MHHFCNLFIILCIVYHSTAGTGPVKEMLFFPFKSSSIGVIFLHYVLNV